MKTYTGALIYKGDYEAVWVHENDVQEWVLAKDVSEDLLELRALEELGAVGVRAAHIAYDGKVYLVAGLTGADAFQQADRAFAAASCPSEGNRIVRRSRPRYIGAAPRLCSHCGVFGSRLKATV